LSIFDFDSSTHEGVNESVKQEALRVKDIVSLALRTERVTMNDVTTGAKPYTTHIRFRYHRGSPVALRLIRCYHGAGAGGEKLKGIVEEYRAHAHVSHSSFSGVNKAEGEVR
jgi:hypothetical protein